MPKYDGLGLAAGAFGGALSDMFKGMAEGAERQPELARSWQSYDQQQQKFPLQQQMLQEQITGQRGANEQTGVNTGLLREELGNRPTQRQREASGEQRAQEAHGWAGAAEGRAGATFGYTAAAQARAERAREAMQNWVQKNGGRINLSDPRQMQELNSILAEHGGDPGIAHNPIAQEGIKASAPPNTYEGGVMRILAKPMNSWSPQEQAMVKQWNRERTATATANESLANFRDSRAGYFDSRKGLGGMDAKDLQRNWMQMQSDAFKNAKLVMQDLMGSQDMSKLGSNPQEIMAGLNWLKSIYIKKQLAAQPLMSEWLEGQLGGPYAEETMPAHIAQKAAAAKEPWFFQRWMNSLNQGVSNNMTNPNQASPTLPPGWSIQQVPE